MKLFLRLCWTLALALVLVSFGGLALAQQVGKATADFPNLKPNRQETAWDASSRMPCAARARRI